jgi:hypothetical protein
MTLPTPHAFAPSAVHGQCVRCGGYPDASYHNLALFSDVDRERQIALDLAQAEEMTAKLRTPLKDVSQAAGIIERESPLFFGTGDNPSLF